MSIDLANAVASALSRLDLESTEEEAADLDLAGGRKAIRFAFGIIDPTLISVRRSTIVEEYTEMVPGWTADVFVGEDYATIGEFEHVQSAIRALVTAYVDHVVDDAMSNVALATELDEHDAHEIASGQAAKHTLVRCGRDMGHGRVCGEAAGHLTHCEVH